MLAQHDFLYPSFYLSEWNESKLLIFIKIYTVRIGKIEAINVSGEQTGLVRTNSKMDTSLHEFNYEVVVKPSKSNSNTDFLST